MTSRYVPWQPPAANVGWHTLLSPMIAYDAAPFGPMGEQRRIITQDGAKGAIIVSQADHDDVEWLHASIAFTERMPTYEELAILHRAVFGRKRYSYQLFVPESSHVNIHAHALHLWGRVDGKPALPDFGKLLGSV